MKHLFIILIAILTLTSCTKREVLFEREVTADYDLPLILNLNGKDCLYDLPTNTLKYTLDEHSLIDFAPLTVFKDYSEVKFNGQLLNNKTIEITIKIKD